MATITATAMCASCIDDRAEDSSTYEQSEDILRACAVNWTSSLAIAVEVIEAAELVEGEVDEFVVVKSGAESGSRYAFASLVVADTSGFLVFAEPGTGKAHKVPVKPSLVEDYVRTLFALAARVDGKIVSGTIERLSHIPCEFMLARKGSDSVELFSVGIIGDTAIQRFISDIHSLVRSHDSIKPESEGARILPMPSDSQVKEFRKRIADDPFIEVQSWERDH